MNFPFAWIRSGTEAPTIRGLLSLKAGRISIPQVIYCRRENGIPCLPSTRLSIIDLTRSANQPMSNEDESVWIVYNGEIYNFMEIRKVLESKGHIFRSRSDTEVIVHGYEEWGTGVLDQLRGMFAFALLDRKNERLILAGQARRKTFKVFF